SPRWPRDRTVTSDCRSGALSTSASNSREGRCVSMASSGQDEQSPLPHGKSSQVLVNREEGHKVIEKRAPAKLQRERGDPSVAAAAPQGNPGIPSNSSRTFIASLIRGVAISRAPCCHCDRRRARQHEWGREAHTVPPRPSHESFTR